MNIKPLRRSLAFQLWASLALVVLGLMAFHLWLVGRERSLSDTALDQAEELAGVLERLLIHELEHEHADGFREHLKVFEDDPSILAVRLLRPDTQSAFTPPSSEPPQDPGTVIDPTLPCASCHQAGETPSAVSRILDESTGLSRVMVARPLGAHPACGRCHERDQYHRATLHVAFAGSRTELMHASRRRQLSIAATGALLVTLVGLGFLVHFLVRLPLQRVLDGVHKVEAGQLSTRVPIPHSAELGSLARSFNVMTRRLKKRHQEQETTIRDQLGELESSQVKILHQEKLAGLGLMAAGIAHEIGNPLASISAAAQVLSRRTTDEFTKDQVKLILKHIDRISRTVRDLSDFSRPPSLSPEATQVNDVVRTAISLLQHDRRFQRVTVDFALDPTLPRIRLIPDHLLEIVFNLGLNAMEAMEEKGRLAITSGREDGRVWIRFQDSGPGIPAENRSRIFEPFFTTKPTGKGTGLGLSVSYGLARSLGGELILEKSERGACFLLTLPEAGLSPSEPQDERKELGNARSSRELTGT